MSDFFQEIVNELSDEEKQILDKIQNKLLSSLEDQKNQKNQKLEDIVDPYIDLSTEHPDIIKKKNITGSPNELVFIIKAEASQIGEQGQLLSIVDIIEKFYHIPIQTDDDYKPHIDKFFDKFHTTLEETCRIIHSNKKHEK